MGVDNQATRTISRLEVFERVQDAAAIALVLQMATSLSDHAADRACRALQAYLLNGEMPEPKPIQPYEPMNSRSRT